MQEITWTVTEDVKTKKKRAHRPPFEMTDKTPKGQALFIEGWNEMRQDCIDHGIMEPE